MTGTGAEVDDIQAETKSAWLHIGGLKQETTCVTGPGAEVDDIQVETKRAWVHIGSLKQETTTDAVKRFLAKKRIFENVICEETKPRYRTKAFKVGIPFNFLERANETDFCLLLIFSECHRGIIRIKQHR